MTLSLRLNPLILKHLFYIVLFNILTINVLGQDTLPRIDVKNRSGKVIISWTNPYTDIVLINIQRSPDSLKNFKTIHSVADPGGVTNGYLDAKAPDTKQFYRLFVQQSGGKYFFTNAFKPYLDTAKPKPKPKTVPPPPAKQVATSKQDPTSPTTPKETPKEASPSTPVAPPPYAEDDKTYKPATNNSQKIKFSNTVPVGKDTAKIGTPPPKEFTPPPVFVYTNNQGQVIIVLPDNKKNIYSLKFLTDSGTPVFTLNKIRDSHLTIEKANFHNAGWFRCELYENDKFRERFRFYIPKD